MVYRPTRKELDQKIRAARLAVEGGKRYFVEPVKMVGDLQELGLALPSEIWPYVKTALEEIVADHYCGRTPPDKAYEPAVKGLECWQFAWNSRYFKCEMFLRFHLKGENYFHSSLHRSRRKPK